MSWDSRRPPGQRVLGVWLQGESQVPGHGDPEDSGVSTPVLEDSEPIPRVRDGRKYTIVTREYMAQGHDGFLPLKGQKYLVDDESGQITSSIVRKYLLGKLLSAEIGSRHKFAVINHHSRRCAFR